MGLLASQQTKLASAITALKTWEASAKTSGAHITQVNLELDSGTPTAAMIIFEWDDAAGEYAVRTPGTDG